MKKFEDLQFSDSYMFSTILENPKNLEITKEIIELAINRKVKELRVISTEKMIQNKYQGKVSILDVLAEGSDEYFDVEMQLEHHSYFAKRTRMYHSNMDVKMIKEGTSYEDLKESIVIFICKQDYFGLGLPRYTFSSYCDENKELKLEEKRTTIFLNPKSECSEAKLKGFLEFIDCNKATDTFSQLLKDTVEKTKEDEEVKKSYMLMRDYVRDLYAEEFKEAEKKSREEGITIGLEQGKSEEKLSFAKQMLNKNYSIEEIQSLTGLTKEVIINLKNSL